MGCTVVWKPASSAMLSAYYIMRIFEAAGLPPGVINFVPGDAPEISALLLDHPDFGGIHFTGSTGVFNGTRSMLLPRYPQRPTCDTREPYASMRATRLGRRNVNPPPVCALCHCGATL